MVSDGRKVPDNSRAIPARSGAHGSVSASLCTRDPEGVRLSGRPTRRAPDECTYSGGDQGAIIPVGNLGPQEYSDIQLHAIVRDAYAVRRKVRLQLIV